MAPHRRQSHQGAACPMRPPAWPHMPPLRQYTPPRQRTHLAAVPSRLGRARTLGDCQDEPIVRTGALLHARRPVARASFDHGHEPVDHVALRREVRPLLRVHAGRVRRLVHLQAEDGACGGGEEQGQRPHVRTALVAGYGIEGCCASRSYNNCCSAFPSNSFLKGSYLLPDNAEIKHRLEFIKYYFTRQRRFTSNTDETGPAALSRFDSRAALRTWRRPPGPVGAWPPWVESREYDVSEWWVRGEGDPARRDCVAPACSCTRGMQCWRRRDH
eukprot:scaffold45579_cov67-Phaeocystis_antarctica.AAC.8